MKASGEPSLPPTRRTSSITCSSLMRPRRLWDSRPKAAVTGLKHCTGSNSSYLDGFLKTDNDDYGFARFDHQFNANNRLAVRYNVEDTRATANWSDRRSMAAASASQAADAIFTSAINPWSPR